MTIKQKQCLLAYLGYYESAIDGKYGPRSQAATEAFQQDFQLTVDGIFGPATEEKILCVIANGEAAPEPESGDPWEAIKYFTREEFACNCGGKYCDGYPVEPVRELVQLADDVREHFGAPMYISSGVRCEQHNANVGGVSNSRHKLGKAVDFRVKGKIAAEVLGYVHEHVGVRYAYAIDANYVHMDVE